jgi:uncharacterized repeat protein (TIGR03803 family)
LKQIVLPTFAAVVRAIAATAPAVQFFRRFSARGCSMKPISTALFAGIIVSPLLMHARSVEAATETVLYSFCSQDNCPDGAEPAAGVIDENNTLYGTTYYGGNGGYCGEEEHGCGTVFSLDLNTGAESVLHSFGGSTDGTTPSWGLLGIKDKLYGTTPNGGYYGAGTAFSVSLKNDAEKVITSFGCCSDGLYPSGGLIYRKGVLYGTTNSGGAYSGGTLFSLDPHTGVVTVLYAFCSQQNCADGQGPLQLIDVKGTLYGTTAEGGANKSGTVFSLDPETGAETVLYSFCSQENCTDGGYPNAGLIDGNGTLYGTTGYGGEYSGGTVFSLNLGSNAETVLHSFKSREYPASGLLDVKGTLYGTTYFGGKGDCRSGNERVGCGTVFKIDLKTGTEHQAYSFQVNGADGWYPAGTLINVNGTLYGTTESGGRYGYGTVFSITP